MAFTPPTAMLKLIDAALTHGRDFAVQHATDNADNPFATVRVLWPGPAGYQNYEIRAVWHTRDTGTYRLSSVLATWARRENQTLSLTKAVELVTGEYVPVEVADIERQPA